MTTGPHDLSEDLRDALKAAPAPDAARRAEILARAMENFDAHQERDARLRPERDRLTGAAVLSGVKSMLKHLTSRAVLGATASVAVLGFGLAMVNQGPASFQDLPGGSLPVSPSSGGQAAHSVPPGPAGSAPAVAPMAEPMVNSSPMAPISPAPMERMSRQAMPKMSAQNGASANFGASGIALPGAVAETSQDRFAAFDPSALKITAEDPVSTFSVDVDTASWSWIRRALRAGQLPDPAAVRVEEMVNYFPYAYPAPPTGGDDPFALQIARFASPWAEGKDLVRIGLQGQVPELAARPALNLVFLVDTSGSMQGEDRLGLLKTSLSMLLGELRPEDRVAIVAYAGSAGEVLAPTPAGEREKIMAALGGLEAGGSTAGGEGLELAYRLAGQMSGEGRIGRVILATDGDFNVGLTEVDALKDYVAQKRKSGIALSVLGFGRGNLDDALMQALAQNGNGQAAYIDSAEEARRVMVGQAAGMLFPIAGDVKIQVEWNPAEIAEYRLIGYETRALSRVDFADDKVDAGDIGAGHQVTALYEITPVGSAARQSEPLRYGAPGVAADGQEAGWLRLRYKQPGSDVSQMIEAPIPVQAGSPDDDARFAAAVAGFGQLLSGGKWTGSWGYAQAVELALSGRGEDRFGERAAAVELMRLAKALSQN